MSMCGATCTTHIIYNNVSYNKISEITKYLMHFNASKFGF